MTEISSPLFSICLARFRGSGRAVPKPFLRRTHHRPCVLVRQNAEMIRVCSALDRGTSPHRCGHLPSEAFVLPASQPVIPTAGRNLRCSALVIWSRSSYESRLEDKDSRFLTLLRYSRNDRCLSCAKVPFRGFDDAVLTEDSPRSPNSFDDPTQGHLAVRRCPFGT